MGCPLSLFLDDSYRKNKSDQVVEDVQCEDKQWDE